MTNWRIIFNMEDHGRVWEGYGDHKSVIYKALLDFYGEHWSFSDPALWLWSQDKIIEALNFDGTIVMEIRDLDNNRILRGTVIDADLGALHISPEELEAFLEDTEDPPTEKWTINPHTKG